MVRFLFWSLLLLNGGLLAYNLGWLGKFSLDTHEPERLKKQHHTEQISLLSAGAVQELLANEAAPEAAEASPEAAASPAPAATVREAANTALSACLELGSFVIADGPKVEEKLRSLNFAQRQQRQTIMEAAAHMVYIPPQGSKENADKKAAELKRRGIDDFFIMQDNSAMRWAISLGVFKTEEAAKNHLANLNAQGVRTARIGPRSVTASKYTYQFKNVNPAEKQKLEQIRSQLAGAELHECRR